MPCELYLADLVFFFKWADKTPTSRKQEAADDKKRKRKEGKSAPNQLQCSITSITYKNYTWLGKLDANSKLFLVFSTDYIVIMFLLT